MEFSEQLLNLAERLGQIAERASRTDIHAALDRLELAAKQAQEAFSGSWLGYHAYVYYEDFNRPPQGAAFSAEWGLDGPSFARGTRGDWREYDFNGSSGKCARRLEKNADKLML